MSDWIKLYRNIQNSWIWGSDEPYDMRSAWQYLLLNAAQHDDNQVVNKVMVPVKRGEVVDSIRHLSELWKWSRGKTERFLNKLEDDGMVTLSKSKNVHRISISNYDILLSDESQDEKERATDGPPSEPQTGHLASHRRATWRATDGPPGEQHQTSMVDMFTGHGEPPDEPQTGHPTSHRRATQRATDGPPNEPPTGQQEDIENVNKEMKLVIESWNRLDEFGIGKIYGVEKLNQRYDMLSFALRKFGMDKMLFAIEKIKESDFLQGKKGGGWKINFDWFINPDNFVKVFEGKYNNKDGIKNNETHQKRNRTYNDRIDTGMY